MQSWVVVHSLEWCTILNLALCGVIVGEVGHIQAGCNADTDHCCKSGLVVIGRIQ